MECIDLIINSQRNRYFQLKKFKSHKTQAVRAMQRLVVIVTGDKVCFSEPLTLYFCSSTINVTLIHIHNTNAVYQICII